MYGRLRGFHVLIAFGFRASPWQATLFLLSGAVMSLIGPVLAFGSKLLVDAAFAGNAAWALGVVVVMALARGIGLINGLYYIDLLFSVVEKAGSAVDARLIELAAATPGLAHHEQPDYLDQMDLLREERGTLAWMTNATAGIVRVVVQSVASALLLVRLHPALLLLPLVGVVSFLAGRRARLLQQQAAEVTAEPERLRRHLFDVATSATTGKEVRVFGLGSELLARHGAVAAAVAHPRDGADWRAAGLQSLDALVSGAAYAAAIGLVLWQALRGAATPGDVVLAVGLAAGLNAIVFTAVAYGTSFLRVLRVAGRYLWLVDYAESEQHRHREPAAIPDVIREGITLDKVAFHYPGTESPVIEEISLQLPAGAVVALVGENGAGKTTLAKLLCRFYEPSGGRITVDGVDLGRFEVDAWRARVSAAFQDFARLELVARETVGVGDLPRIEDGVAVGAALLRARAEDVPARLPLGLETQLGRNWEDGVELSGGQWQKLALARAMMRGRPLLLILDEPTASLDAEAEHELFERYAHLARQAGAETGTITFLVSHRFSTVRMADLIVVLEHGRVREAGNHEQLMAAGGLYAELYGLQARAYR